MINIKWTTKFAAAFLCLALLGCSSVDEEKEIERQTELKIKKHTEKKEVPLPDVIEAISPLKELNANRSKLNLPVRDGVKAENITPMTYRLADVMKSKSANPATFDEKLNTSFQFENADLITVIDSFKLTLGFQYLIDPGVKGTANADIELEGENSLTKYEAWKLFEEILYMGGAYATLEPSGIIKIMPFIKMPKEKRLLLKGENQGNVAVELIQLLKTPATEIVNNLRPFMTDGASVTVLTRTNSILIVETPGNMEKLNTLIRMLDSNGQNGWPQIAYRCMEMDSATIFAELQTVLPVLGFTLTQGNNADPTGIKISSLDRLSVIVASAPTKEALMEIQKWISVLDTTDSLEQEKVYTYPVKHGLVEDLVAAITTFFPNTTAGKGAATQGRSGSSTSSRAGGGTTGNRNTGGGISAQQLNRTPTTQPRTGNRTTPATSSGSRGGNTDAPLTVFDMPVTLFEDTRRNQIVIRATARSYSMMKAILNHLDAPARQVLIQVTAVEVNLSDSLEYGFEYAAEQAFGDSEGNIGIGNSITDAAAFTPAGGVTPGISALLSKAGVDNEFAFVQAVAGAADSRLLFCPQILTMNGEDAEINIGQEVPIRSGTNTTNGTVQDNIEYRDTGVILTVSPLISADKRVTLTVSTELSSIADDTIGGIDSPVFNENSVSTRLIVDNKETILLGGIIQKNESVSNSGIPFLKDIPYLGVLFSGTSNESGKKELVIFVKATVIDNKSEYEQMLLRYKEALKYRAKSPELEE
ncbi:MAG: hypothetical protein NE328_23635 [Lentisphaeraceae bacterium]|nr:hypothetical protein [Lentisphaeraceae bacterium]